MSEKTQVKRIVPTGVSKTTQVLTNENADEEAILRHRVFLLENAIKNRVQYHEITQFRLKSDLIKLEDLSQELKDMFINDETVQNIMDILDTKADKVDLEKLENIIANINVNELANKIGRNEFEAYKAFIQALINEIRDTMHEYHDEDIHNQGYVRAELDMLKQRIAKLELNGGGGSGSDGNVDLSNYPTRAEMNQAIANIQLTPGPQGPEGPQGEKGEKGDPGVTSWNDLEDKPTIPSKTSELVLDNVYTKVETETIVQSSIDGLEIDQYITEEELREALDSIQSTPGVDGKSVELRKHEGKIQWKYTNESDETWKDLVDLTEITGPQGEKGEKGDPGVTSWNDLEDKPTDLATESFVTEKIAEASLGGGDVDLSGYATIEYVEEQIRTVELTPGPAGQDGRDGVDGQDGQDGRDGVDGKSVELQKSSSHIQWRQTGQSSWTNLVALEDLKGERGEQGPAGENADTSSLMELIASMEETISKLTERVKVLESYHADHNDNIEWEVDFVLAAMDTQVYISEIEGLKDKTITDTDVYGTAEDGVLTRCKLYFCGFPGNPTEPPIRIPLLDVEEGNPQTKVDSFMFDSSGDDFIQFGAGFASPVVIKIIMYREEC